MLQRKTPPDHKSFGTQAIWIEVLMLFYFWLQERALRRKIEPLLMSNRLPVEIFHRKESLSTLHVVTKLIFLSIELPFFMIHFTNAWTTLTREPSFPIFRWKPRWNWKSIRSEIDRSFFLCFIVYISKELTFVYVHLTWLFELLFRFHWDWFFSVQDSIKTSIVSYFSQVFSIY